jgi:protein-S-isoprenylcysteine O-methyltransferase Ste14
MKALAIEMVIQPIPTLVFALVMICWFAFAGVFFFRKNPAASPEQRREPASIPGVVLQGAAYAVVWAVRRPMFSPVVSGKQTIELIVAAGTVGIACISVGIVMAAVKTLGKEWSITARVIEGHKLATQGPYRFVRHPIYTGMLGMLLATGLAISYWYCLLIAVLIFFAGTIIRVRSEEKLLHEQFGAEFEAYVARVPAMLPGVY